MKRPDYLMLLSVGLAWALFFGGLDSVPGWNGFGKGLAIGSLSVLATVVARAVRRTRAPVEPR